MVENSPSPLIGRTERLIVSHAGSYLHDWLSIAIDAIDDFDQIDFMIAATVWNAGLRHIIDDIALFHRFTFEERAIPPDMRKPTSRGATSRFLGLSLETTRRRIDKLIKEGILADRQDGLIAIAFTSMFADKGAKRSAADLLARFHQELKDIGMELPPADWIVEGSDPPSVPQEWLRAVTRVAMDYALLVLSATATAMGVNMSELYLVLGIIRWDIEHRKQLGEEYYGSGLLPDKYRQPIRPSVARQLARLPHATARRKLLSLEARGVVRKSGAGYIVPASMLFNAMVDTKLAIHNMSYLRRMFERLHALAIYHQSKLIPSG